MDFTPILLQNYPYQMTQLSSHNYVYLLLLPLSNLPERCRHFI